MFRSFRWPLMAACLAAGVTAGGSVGPAAVHGELSPAAKAIPAELTSYRDVVKQVLPAVVSIESKVKPKKGDATAGRRGRSREELQQVPEEFRKFFEQFER